MNGLKQGDSLTPLSTLGGFRPT